MDQTEVDTVFARIDAAIARIERAASRDAETAIKHARLRAAVAASLAEIDDMLAADAS